MKVIMAKSKRRRWFSTIEVLRYTSITSVVILGLALYSLWIGYLLIAVSPHLVPAVQELRFGGPLRFWRLAMWGYLFVGVGILELLRLVFHRTRRVISYVLHLSSMSVFVAWAVSYLVGSVGPDVSQPAYSFVALTAISVPYLADILETRRNQPAAEAPDRPDDFVRDTHQ